MDIMWNSGGIELKKIDNVSMSLTLNKSELYEDTYNIPLLSTTDDGRVIECEIIIMTTPSIVATTNVTLEVTSKYYKVLQGVLL